MIYQKIGRIAANQVAQETNKNFFDGPGAGLNKSTLSAIPAKSDCMSDIGDNLFPYMSKHKKITFAKVNYDPFENKSQTYDNRSNNNSKLETTSFKAIMEIKGSKCKCIKGSKGKCSTYCRKNGSNAQRRIIANLLQLE